MTQRTVEKFGLSTFALKIIAMVTMLLDHIGIVFCQNLPTAYYILRSIGRISFPLFCFILTEGFFHTRDRKKYALRLFVFALISEIPYNKFGGSFFDTSRQNVMFTLLIGFLVIWVMDLIENYKIKYPESILKHVNIELLNAILEFAAIMIGLYGAYELKSVYSYIGVILIILFYVSHESHAGQLLSNMIFNMGLHNFSKQWFGVLSAIPIALYNGKPGNKKGKYFFYLFYPVHLIALIAIRYVLKRIM